MRLTRAGKVLAVLVAATVVVSLIAPKAGLAMAILLAVVALVALFEGVGSTGSQAGAKRGARSRQTASGRHCAAAAERNTPLFGGEAATFLDQVFQRADAFLSAVRPTRSSPGSWGTGSWGEDPISTPLNTRPKYVASTPLTEPQWADTTGLPRNIAAAVIIGHRCLPFANRHQSFR